ncbi:hypothetical protein [Arthrobacter sp. MYb227]|uniref:hypothetical protein n=1 Tax=Arthrobacter sp. MYb227 TaxID=1848601 RepID=UPI0011B0123C|nr:hypothetical protein [Arthrobacter sp. MYb227]
MTKWSRNLFGASMVFCMVGIVFAERLPEWWIPVSLLLVVLAAAGFLIRSIVDYRNKSAAI